jgi:DNA-binding response OmpR family regulator
MANVLLLEPNRLLANSYTLALKKAGHQVRHYARGQRAIESADKQTPDVVIVELQIAAHNGLEFLYEFRSYPEWQHIPVIIQSVIPPHVIEHSAALSQLGVRHYLYKPSTKLQHLVEAVAEVHSVSV